MLQYAKVLSHIFLRLDKLPTMIAISLHLRSISPLKPLSTLQITNLQPIFQSGEPSVFEVNPRDRPALCFTGLEKNYS